MDADVPFSMMMGVTNWKWEWKKSCSQQGLWKFFVGTQKMPRRKSTDWQCPPLGKWGSRRGHRCSNSLPHTQKRTCIHTCERAQVLTHACTSVEMQAHTHAPASTMCTLRERTGTVVSTVRALLPGRTLFLTWFWIALEFILYYNKLLFFFS